MKKKQSFHALVKATSDRRILIQLFFVFAAFAIMTITGYFFVQRILWHRLIENSQNYLSATESYIHSAFADADISLINTCHTIRDRINSGASQKNLLQYLRSVTAQMRERKGALQLYGVYGYIRGEFIDGVGMSPGPDYIPQQRPWYQTAVRNIGSVSYTSPYLDAYTGDTIVSAVMNIDDEHGKIIGILAIDINIDWLNEYVRNLNLSKGGYGLILSQNMTIVAHPNGDLRGSQLHELGMNYDKISNMLRSGEGISAELITDYYNETVLVFFSQLFNGWYIGLITPRWTFYREVYYALGLLTSLGLVLSFCLSFLLLRLEAARIRSDEENKTKSSFLARISHEIRTPMNAITGISELLLTDNELSTKARKYAKDIRQASSNLLSIINDLLDFSKIEAGRLDIIHAKFTLSSLIHDTVNIIRMRIINKPIRFFTNIDSTIPNNLLGDEVRLRQILLNLLGNAVKYTEKGFISLNVTEEKPRKDNKLTLRFVISDSGFGIQPEDQPKLFDDFVQVNSKKNRSIEGTGLGLAITKRLCVAMGGDISVESEYDKGSTFIVIMPLDAESDAPFALVGEPEKKKVLVYEKRKVYAQSLEWSLKNMRVPHKLIFDLDALKEALREEEWYFVFSGYGLYEYIKPTMEQPLTEFKGGKKPHLALMVEWDTEDYIPGVRFVSLPIQGISIAEVLNGVYDHEDLVQTSAPMGTRFTAPDAHILIVDDISINLEVAEALMLPYQIKIDTCLGGEQSLELIYSNTYDIVFMDHMMPEMDGIETTKRIREWENKQPDTDKQLPIIALTANAVSGMREMFLLHGFNDFISKPIEISKLDRILEKWIPKDKQLKSEP